MNKSIVRQLLTIPVIVAALGYFVDIYDLLLFGIVRLESLKDIGITDAKQQLSKGVFLMNVQMIGMLIGGIVWGIFGDKRGRLSVLFGSILLYSLANIANGFVTNVNQYAVLRFIAGLGLAGELGAGITLVAEILPKEIRGYGTTLIASVGVLGAVLANFVSELTDWRVCYFIGGGLGIVLLITRISVHESGMFKEVKEQSVERGDLLQLFNNGDRFRRYLSCILIGLPIWYVIGVLVLLSPEFGKALGLPEPIVAGRAIMCSYIGLSIGDMASGLLSQWVKSRKKILLLFIILTAIMIAAYSLFPFKSTSSMYFGAALLGVAVGYWALFVTVAAEQFGTNLRATAATTVPNFIRGTLPLLSSLFLMAKDRWGMSYGALAVGAGTIVIALAALTMIRETFSSDLNFVEED